MKIAILTPKAEFSAAQQEKLARLGDVVYTRSREEYPLDELIEFCASADVIAFDPDNIGGFSAARERLVQLMDGVANLKGIALVTTSFGYVDLDYCRRRGITVTNVPYYATEAVAEDALAFLLGCAKRIFLTDRRTQRGEYKLELGFELRGKTLGVIGLGHIGTRVAELGIAIGMKAIGWNRSPKDVPGVESRSLDALLAESDAVVLCLADNEETAGFLSKERIAKIKEGAIVVNIAPRTLVDEDAMAETLKSGKIDSYVQECDEVTSPPLGDIENAFLFKYFGWYTKEALERNFNIWIDNIEGILNDAPVNPV